MQRQPRPPSPAFTLIELLVCIAIIALLVAILVPALAKGQATAKYAASLSAMRQVMLGYTTYQHDHRDHVPYGYCPATVDGSPIRVTLRSGHVIPDPSAGPPYSLALPVMRYPVRLVPYVANAWAILYNHTEPLDEPQPGDSIAEAWTKAYVLSTDPTFGINSVYVGGDRNFDSFVGPTFTPNRNKHVVFAGREVRRPSSLIVFTDSKQAFNGVVDPELGYHLATPPVARGRHWSAAGDTFSGIAPGFIGVPEGRHVGAAVTGFFDGHAAGMRPVELDDMTLWSNIAQTTDEDYAP